MHLQLVQEKVLELYFLTGQLELQAKDILQLETLKIKIYKSDN